VNKSVIIIGTIDSHPKVNNSIKNASLKKRSRGYDNYLCGMENFFIWKSL